MRGQVASDAPVADRPDRSSTIGGVVIALLLTVVLTQRLALPVGAEQIPLTVPLTLAVIAVGLWLGALVVHPVGVRLFAIAIIAVTFSTVATVLLGGNPSGLSLVFLVSLYVLGCLRPATSLVPSADRVQRFFLALMSVSAVMSLLQLGLQYLGVPHRDWLATVLPAPVLLQGYNTGDPVVYGSDLYRSNAIIFLEPSFLSYFLGAAIVLAVARRAPLWQITLLVAGVVPTLAGNGIIVAGVGLLVLAAGSRRRYLLRLLPPLVVGSALAALTPLADLYLNRTTEISSENTSSSLRFVQPWEFLLPEWVSSPAVALFGRGAGSASDYIEQTGVVGLLAPVIPKALLEYGLVGAVPLLLFLGWLLLRGLAGRPWALGLVLGYLFINAALLQATLALGTLVLIRWLPPLPPERPVPGPWLRREQRSAAREIRSPGQHRSDTERAM